METIYYVIMNNAGEYLNIITGKDGRPQYEYTPVWNGFIYHDPKSAEDVMEYTRRLANTHNGVIKKIRIIVEDV